LVIHSNNRQLVVRGTEGSCFQAALTHVEVEGKHIVVVTVSDENRPRLERNASQLTQLLRQKYKVENAHLVYFERGQNGAAAQVDPSALSLKQSTRHGKKAEKRSGKPLDDYELRQQLRGASLPSVATSPWLSRIVARTKQNTKAVLRGTKRFVSGYSQRSHRPRPPRPG